MVTLCAYCGAEFEALRRSARYCSARCRVADNRRRKRAAPELRRRERDRDRKRAQRAAERADREATAPAAPELPSDLVGWCSELLVTQGQGVGERLELLPWEREFLRRLETAGTAPELGLSVPSGAGKTTLAAAVCAAAVAGPLAQPRAAVIGVAGAFAQALILSDHVQAFLRPITEADPERWRVLRSEQVAVVEDRLTGAHYRAREASAGTLHGSAPALVVADEPAQWKRTQADAIYAALRSRLGKIPGARLLAIGTRPATGGHWFNRLLNRNGVTYAADPEADPFAPATWHAANPSLAAMPELLETYEREAAEAEADSSLLAGFLALRLNMGTADVEVAGLLEAGTWEGAEVDLLPAARGGYVLGFDLGGSAAMSAAAAYWWASGRLEALAWFASVPDLAKRGRRDAVGALYADMHARGELLLHPGRVVAPGEVLRAAVKRWGRPAAVVGDRYREAELRQAVEDAKLRAPVAVRGMGYADGAADVRAFQRAVLGGKVFAPRSLLLRSAMSEARTISDPSGNAKLAKRSEGGRRALARDDAAAAAVLAVAEGTRAAHRGRRGRRGWRVTVA